jgi:hypothetical protein
MMAFFWLEKLNKKRPKRLYLPQITLITLILLSLIFYSIFVQKQL